ncbi:MAG: FtsW/RodA/SpoVE family cell cycle protein [Candidatus Cloacimonetes bacterium]|nr:FtsW/RodA/SpoVE family cell cycle protein [Candidatus Cloacimonadota bacterium]
MNKIISKLENIDTPLVFCYLLLIMIGLFIQMDITSANGHMNYFLKQLIFTIFSITACLLTYLFLKVEWLQKRFWYIYGITLILLILVLVVGVVVNGAKRVFYIPLGFTSISVQPSLLARLTLIIFFARVLSSREQFLQNSSLFPFFKNFMPLFIFSIPVYVLILFERHFSAIIISAVTLLSVLFLANIKLATIIILIFCLFFAGILAIYMPGGEYRLQRIKVFLENSLIVKFLQGEKITVVTDYNTEHSLICLTSGKIFGTTPENGFGKYYYLPEPRTDYVFSIIGEEFGLFGSLILIFVFMGLVIRGLNISSRQEILFLKLLGYGISLNLFYNMVVNIGVATAAIPPTGVTLPFISHGGSSMLVNSISIGILLLLSRKAGVVNEMPGS